MPEGTEDWTKMKTGDNEGLEIGTPEWTEALSDIRGEGGWEV